MARICSDDGVKPIDRDPYERAEASTDPNLINLIANWKHHGDNTIFFLGAGSSVGARNRLGRALPTAFHLRTSLWRDFMVNQPDSFNPESLGFMSLEHAAALVERSAGRDALITTLIDGFSAEAPLWQHAVLPFLRPKGLFTTNYDSLIEKGWALHASTENLGSLRKYFRDEEPDTQLHIPLYKPHGTLERAGYKVGEGGLVITQFDYIEMLEYRRSALRRCLENLQNACIIFIGYSFQDLDIATALYEMRNPYEKRKTPWYAVFPRSDENVRGMYEERYGIRQINRTFFNFILDIDDALGVIPEQWKFKGINSLAGVVKPQATNCTAAVPNIS
jgi:hypothetical protein